MKKKQVTELQFKVIIEQDKDSGHYIASVPDLHGCHTQGKTVEEARKNIREVIDLVFEDDDIRTDELSYRNSYTNFVAIENIAIPIHIVGAKHNVVFVIPNLSFDRLMMVSMVEPFRDLVLSFWLDPSDGSCPESDAETGSA